MDVESQQTLDEMVDRLAVKVVPALEAALGRQLAQSNADLAALIDRATGEVSNMTTGVIQGLQSIADKTMAQFDGILSRGFSLRPAEKP